MKNLDVKLSINNYCELVSIDKSTNIDSTNHICVEFLSSDIYHPLITNIKGNNIYGYTSKIKLPHDGEHIYYKFLIPLKEHFTEIPDNEIYYDDGKIFYKNHSKSTEINFNDLIKLDTTLSCSQTFFCKKTLFSICKLQNCLVYLQRQILSNPDYCMECGMETSIRYKRDFLVSSLYVLNYLIKNQLYEEAQRILLNMEGCGGLCEHINSKDDCGCGKVVY